MLPWSNRVDWMIEQIKGKIRLNKLKVVEFGSATGEISRALLKEGCGLTAIEARQESHQVAMGIKPVANLVLADLESLKPTQYELCVHIGVLYHLLGPIEHLMLLPEWAPRVFLDTHYTENLFPEMHIEQYMKPRAGLRNSSWWLPQRMILNQLKDSYKTVEVLNDRTERNGPRMTVWASND